MFPDLAVVVPEGVWLLQLIDNKLRKDNLIRLTNNGFIMRALLYNRKMKKR